MCITLQFKKSLENTSVLDKHREAVEAEQQSANQLLPFWIIAAGGAIANIIVAVSIIAIIIAFRVHTFFGVTVAASNASSFTNHSVCWRVK